MYAEIDRDRVRRLAMEILDAIGEETGGRSRSEMLREIGEADTPYTTAELAKVLGVSQAWITQHVSEFPGAFRLSEGQRANYRFPREGVAEYIKRRSV